MKNLPSWGKHLVVDGAGCTDSINNRDHIIQFIDQLVMDIDMKAHGRPVVEWFAEGDKAGFTAVQLIETSAIVIHFVPHTWTLHADIFSCKSFDSDVVIKLMTSYFGMSAFNVKEFERESPDISTTLGH
jgi:S-adenosylmethionine/arginine decarboxylase-like enzyme